MEYFVVGLVVGRTSRSVVAPTGDEFGTRIDPVSRENSICLFKNNKSSLTIRRRTIRLIRIICCNCCCWRCIRIFLL